MHKSSFCSVLAAALIAPALFACAQTSQPPAAGNVEKWEHFVIEEKDPIFRQVKAFIDSKADGYDANQKCWEYNAANESCRRLVRIDRVTRGAEQYIYVLLSGQSEELSPQMKLITAYILHLQNGQWKEWADPGDTHGLFDAKTWKLIQVGPATWGWYNRELRVESNGDRQELHVVLAPWHQNIIRAAGIPALLDDTVSCTNGTMPCSDRTQVNSTLAFDSNDAGNEFFPIRLTVNGQRLGKPITQRIWTANFDKTYQVYDAPPSYPIPELLYED